MKAQKSAVIAVFLAILAVFCFFTACKQEPEPQVEMPRASPWGGSQPSAQTVTLTTGTGGADIYYTLNGTDPTTASTLYSKAIAISTTTTLKAFAVKSGWKDSDVLTATYTFPENRTENINLGTMTAANSGWRQLLDSINTAGKHVNLDLSSCTMASGVFDPDASYGTLSSKKYIVSLILPAAATSIVGASNGFSSYGAFDGFSNLTSINGANITEIGDEVFLNIGNLQSVGFPKATTIGNNAFFGCSSLQSVSLPQATTIGNNAFSGCSSLQSVSLPQATTIGYEAFSSCSSLQSINLPKVTNIGRDAFTFTPTALVITMGSTAPATLSSDIFGSIYNTTGVRTVTVKVPNGATGYSPFNGTSVTVSGTNADVNWANGFRGRGWTGSAFLQYTSINQNISLTIQQQ